MIKFRCRACGETYSVSDKFAGREFDCRECGEPLRVPRPKPSSGGSGTPRGGGASPRSGSPRRGGSAQQNRPPQRSRPQRPQRRAEPDPWDEEDDAGFMDFDESEYQTMQRVPRAQPQRRTQKKRRSGRGYSPPGVLYAFVLFNALRGLVFIAAMNSPDARANVDDGFRIFFFFVFVFPPIVETIAAFFPMEGARMTIRILLIVEIVLVVLSGIITTYRVFQAAGVFGWDNLNYAKITGMYGCTAVWGIFLVFFFTAFNTHSAHEFYE